MSQTSQSAEYGEFRSQFPLKRLVVDETADKVWGLYDAGPRDVDCPILFFPAVSATAEVFFKQIMFLSANGYRVISVSYPVYWSLREYTTGFIRLLDHLRLDKVHVFGASVGGYIAQKVAESISNCQRIQSLILCNSFSDTSAFHQTEAANLFWMMPAVLLKRSLIQSSTLRDPLLSRDSEIADSIFFVAELLDSLSQAELASRLTVNCTNSYVEPHRLQSLPVTIMDVFDGCVLSQRVRDDIYKMYPNARRAHLKTGGNFPYLSRPEEVNMHIIIHLRAFWGTRYSAQTCLIPHPTRSTTSGALDSSESDDAVDEAYELLT